MAMMSIVGLLQLPVWADLRLKLVG